LYAPSSSADGDTLLGYPIVENPHMPSIGTGEKSVAFGHWPSYYVRVAGGLRFDVSDQAYFANDQIGFRFLMRLDGGLTVPSHIKVFEGGAS